MSGEGDKKLIRKHLEVLLRLSEEWMTFNNGYIVSCPDQIATVRNNLYYLYILFENNKLKLLNLEIYLIITNFSG